jgi:hypothetical protein
MRYAVDRNAGSFSDGVFSALDAISLQRNALKRLPHIRIDTQVKRSHDGKNFGAPRK